MDAPDTDRALATDRGRRLGALCHRRAAAAASADGARPRRGYSVAANGMVIEQAQILTTHNLALLAGPVGVVPTDGWAALARRTFRTVTRLTGRLDHNPRPLPMVKDVAYAWRHLVCHLSLPDGTDPRTVVGQLHTDLAACPEGVRQRLTPALVGLGHVAAGGRFTEGRTPADGRRLLGWSTGRHWLLDQR